MEPKKARAHICFDILHLFESREEVIAAIEEVGKEREQEYQCNDVDKTINKNTPTIKQTIERYKCSFFA